MDRKHPLAKCESCPLKNQTYVPSYTGGGNGRFVFIGEAPGHEEAIRKQPFVGQSGKLLRSVSTRAGIDITEQVLTNAVSCHPPGNREPTAQEIECCFPRLAYEIETYASEATIVTLGKTAAQTVLGEAKYSDRVSQWNEWRSRPVISTWHPAYVLRQPGQMHTLMSDIARAQRGRHFGPLSAPPGFFVPADAIQLHDWLQTCPYGATVAFDLETDNVIWYDTPTTPADEVLMLGMAWSPDEAVIVPADMLAHSPGVWGVLQAFFDREDLTFVGHNAKFDELFLRSIGLEVHSKFDTFLAHYVLYEDGTHGLKALAAEYFDLHDYEQALVQKYLKNRNDRYSKVPFIHLAQYCAWDVVVTWSLKSILEEQLRADGLYEWPFMNVIMKAHKALAQVEWLGIAVDRDYLTRMGRYMQHEMNVLELDLQSTAAQEIIDLGKDKRVALIKKAHHLGHKGGYPSTIMDVIALKSRLNVRSPQQLACVMYDVLKLPAPTGRRMSPRTTAKGALDQLEGKHPFVDSLKTYRRIHKMQTSYVQNILTRVDTQERVHTTFWINGTEVGRLSSSNPALMTIPRPYEDKYGAIIRGSFVAGPGKLLIHADYSQAELRVAAVLSGEPFLIQVYQDGRDLHTEVAVAMFSEDFTRENRVHTKMFNFSYLYGGSEYSFAEDAGLPLQIARKFVRDYNRVMPRLAEWKREQFEKARTKGYVDTPFGRRRRFPLITNANLEDVRKACVHMPVASTAADLTLLSMCRLVDMGYDVVLEVHDAILVEIDEEEAEAAAKEVVAVMVDVASTYLPEVRWEADAEIGPRWYNNPPDLETGNGNV